MRSDFLTPEPSSGGPQRPSAWLLGAHLAASILGRSMGPPTGRESVSLRAHIRAQGEGGASPCPCSPEFSFWTLFLRTVKGGNFHCTQEPWASPLHPGPPGICPTPSREQPPLSIKPSSQGDTSLSNVTLPGQPRPPSPGQLPHPGSGTNSSSSRWRSHGTSVFQPYLLKTLPRESITLPPSRKQGVLLR